MPGFKRDAAISEVDARLIGILSRTFGEAACQEELAALLAHREGITALDLAGDELGFPGTLFRNHFNPRPATPGGISPSTRAKRPARKVSGRPFVSWARSAIGHGVKAVEDPALMDYLAEHRIGIESCLTSNVQTSTVASLAQHPLKQFLEHGVLASLNTDDPAVRGCGHHSRVYRGGAGGRAEPGADPSGADQRPDPGVPRRTGKSRPHSAGCQRLITGPAAVLPGSSSDQAERGAMSGRLDTQLNQGHYLNRLAGRDRVFPTPLSASRIAA